MLKELLLMPAVLGCSLGGSASTAVRHNAVIDSGEGDCLIDLEFSFGSLCDGNGDPLDYSVTDISSATIANPYFTYGGDSYTLTVDDQSSGSDTWFVSFNFNGVFVPENFESFEFTIQIPTFNDCSLHVTDASVLLYEGALSTVFEETASYDGNTLFVPAPPISQNGVAIVNEIVSILVGGLVSLGTGIGAGISNFASALAFADGALSPYFVLVIAFAGIALAIALTSRIFAWLTNLGN